MGVDFQTGINMQVHAITAVSVYTSNKSVCAVSYTHLDVYKRQIMDSIPCHVVEKSHFSRLDITGLAFR